MISLIIITIIIIWQGDPLGDVQEAKGFKFDHTNKWYIHKQAYVLENDTHKHLRYFDIETDHLMSARNQTELLSKKKKNLQNRRLCCHG